MSLNMLYVLILKNRHVNHGRTVTSKLNMDFDDISIENFIQCTGARHA